MIKLIKLEWRKNHIGTYIGSAVILAVLLGLFLFALAFLGIANDPDGTLDAAPGADTISSSIELFTGMAYLIFTSVMLSSFIVTAYQNKTMNLMFSYPISRKKILAAQMAAVWIFGFTALVLTKLLLYAEVDLGSRWMRSSFLIDVDLSSPSLYAQILFKSFVTVSMGFIALFIGMAMKSTKATIVASFLLIFLTQANVGDFTMADNATFPLILTVISFGLAALSIRGAEQKDVM